ncbi:MAG: cytidylate kinase [Deltaproteobacteria bacterium HGW-Deltaproteobacteria-10]|nr:MAG: cytidylate kinase [Deltaproteobacteria bacterium HGW-Deltaproteobacteria-10]
MHEKMIITIDGPAGAGKSTVSKMLAKRLGYIYLDTGALYRALAYKALKDEVVLDDLSALDSLCSNIDIVLKNIDGQMKVYVDGEDVGDKIRTEEIGLIASKISALAFVRQRLLHIQREAGAQGGIVAEGRDMGSVVFPHADYKFYLDANIEERTKRRHKELLGKGNLPELQSIQKDMLERDNQDSKREIAPLKPTSSSIIIDSTKLSLPEVIEKIIQQMSHK